MCATSGKIRAEAIATDVRHVLFLGYRRDGALRVLFHKSLVEEDEVGETTADTLMCGLERLEIGLQIISNAPVSWYQIILTSVVTRYDT